MEVGPGDGKRIFRTLRTEPRKQAVKGCYEDVPFCVSGLCLAPHFWPLMNSRLSSSHHHVESVHFQTPDKKAFHPAVATVQTLAREYYLLKDNGMLIGTEEDGVNPLWQALLVCDEKGLPCDSSAPLYITR